MSRFEEKLLAAKAKSAQRVSQAKEAILAINATAPSAAGPYDYNEVHRTIPRVNIDALSHSIPRSNDYTSSIPNVPVSTLYPSPLLPKSPVVGTTKHGSLIHENGTFTAISAHGEEMHYGLTEQDADRISAHSRQEQVEREQGIVDPSILGRKAAGFKDTSVDVGKGLIQGPIIGATSLEEQVDERNDWIKTQRTMSGGILGFSPRTDPLFEKSYEPPKPSITPEQIKEYEAIKATPPKELTEQQKGDQSTEIYKELAELDKDAQANKERFETTENIAAALKDIYPGSYKDQIAAKAGFDAVAKNDGTWEAIKYTFDNDLTTLLSSGIDNTPWMIAYTIGGPLTQMGIITSLARSKGRQAIEEFKITEGRNPDAKETQRIKLWMAIGSVAEKYGDLAALRAFKGNLPFLKNVSKALAGNTTAKILSLPTIIAIRTGTVLGGEGLSGAITSYAEQIAKHGKVTDPATIAYDALAEAAGTPGGLATYASGQLAYGVGKDFVERRTINEADIKDQIQKSEAVLEQLNNNEIKTVKDTPQGKAAFEALQYESPLIASEDQIKIDEDGNAEPTSNPLFNAIYNWFLKEGGINVTDDGVTENTGLNWRDALTATEKDMQQRLDALNPHKRITAERKAQEKRNYKAHIERLKKDLEKRKFGGRAKKTRKELFEEPVPPRTYTSKKQKEEKAELAAAETEVEKTTILKKRDTKNIDTTIAEITADKKSSNEQKVERLQLLQSDKKYPLNPDQKTQIKKLLKKYTPAEVKGKIKEEESLSNLQKLSKPTKENEKEHQDIIEELESGKLTAIDKAILNAAKELRKYFNKLRSIGRQKKTIEQVNEEIISGTAAGYKGFSTFREAIIQKLDENRNADSATIKRNQLYINNQLKGMQQHLLNLKNKLIAFKKSKETEPKKKGNIIVVRGTKSEEQSDGAARYMEYTLEEMTHAEYLDLRNNQKQFVNYITNQSGKLLTQIQDEINYGEQAVFIAENHGSTSFFDAATKRAEQLKTDQVLADQIAALEKQVDLEVEDITDADIEAIEDPTITPSPGITTPTDPRYANQSFTDLVAESNKQEVIILEFTSQSERLSAKQEIALQIAINTKTAIDNALANKPAETTPTTPVAPSPEGREGATVEETIPTEEDTLTEEDYSIPETKEVVRFVGKSEVDSLIRGEKFTGKFKDDRVDVTTDMEGQNVPATTTDYRIRFKDKDSSTVRMKSEQDGWLLDGYDINDVASIEEKQPDGSWKTIDLTTKEVVEEEVVETEVEEETKAPTTYPFSLKSTVTPTPTPTTEVPTTDVEYQGRIYKVKGIGEQAQIFNDKGQEVYKTSGNRPRILGEAAVLRGTAVATTLKKARVIVTIGKDGNLRVMNGNKTSKSYGNVMKWGPEHGNIRTLESNAAVIAFRKGIDEVPTVEEQPQITTEDQPVEVPPSAPETTPPVIELPAADTIQDEDTGQERPTRRIPQESQSKQAYRIVFPQIITKEGTLKEDAELEKHSELVEELAEELGVSKEDIGKALEALPNAKSFIDENTSDAPRVLSFKQLKESAKEIFDRAVTAAIKIGKLSKDFHTKDPNTQRGLLLGAKIKNVEQREQSRPEKILGILSKIFEDLIKVKSEKGLQTIPNFVFNNTQLLKQAILDLLPEDSKTAETTAHQLATEFKRYKTKYNQVRADTLDKLNKQLAEGAITQAQYDKAKSDTLVYASAQPLLLLHFTDNRTTPPRAQLPNVVVFMMMLGVTNFVHQRSSQGNQPFMHNHEMVDFLYNGNEELSDNELGQVNNLGYDYRILSNQIGAQIVKALNFKSKLAPEYYEKLKTALGMQALQVNHGIFDYRTADKSINEGKGPPLTKRDKESAESEPTAPFQIEIYTWNFEDAWKINRNYNNPITEKEARALEKKLKLKKGTITENQGEYIHIRFNEKQFTTFDADGATALAEINKALKLGLEDRTPLQEPVLEVNTRIRNSIGKIANKIIKTIKSQQKETWRSTESMSIVGLLTNSSDRNRIIVEKQLGVDDAANDENTHKLKRQSLESSNRTTLANFNNVLHAFNTGTLKRFFVKYRLQNQLRYLMEGPDNPQQDKNVRHLVKAFETNEFNEKNIHLFQLSVAFNFGIKVDKHNLPQVIKEFKAIVKDPNVLEAVQLLNQINKIKDKSPDITEEELNKDGLLDQFADSLVPLNGAYSTNIALIGGLTALSRYMTVTGKRDDQKGSQEGLRKTTNSTFESDVPLEIDGIANGFMINVLQFPNFQETGDLTELIDLLSKVGIYPGKDANSVTHNVYAPDSYQSLAILMNKYTSLDSPEVTEYLKNSDIEVSPEETSALHALYKDLVDKSGNFALLRDLVKYPFLIYLYGGGIQSISEGVGKKIHKDLIDQLDLLQKKYNAYTSITVIDKKGNKKRIKIMKFVVEKDGSYSHALLPLPAGVTIDEKGAKEALALVANFIENTWSPFITNLETIGAFKKGQYAWTENLVRNNTQGMYFNEANVIRNIGRILRPRLDLSLTEMLGATTESRKAVIKAGELLNAIFIVKFEKAYAAHLKETGRDYLTEKEVNEFIRNTPELNNYYPEYQVPLATKGETATIDLTKRKQTDEQDRVGEVQFVYTDKLGEKKTHQTTTRTFKFVLPGPAVLTRTIMNIDSSAMTRLLGTHGNILGLHDGAMGDPITLLNAAGTFGNILRDLNFENSILDNIYNLVQDRWDSLNDLDGSQSEEQKAIDKWILENGYDNQHLAKGQSPETSEDILDTIHEANETNNQHRENLQEMSKKGGSILQLINHMYMPVQLLPKIKEIVAKLGLKKFKFKPSDQILPENKKDDFVELEESSEGTREFSETGKRPTKTPEEKLVEDGAEETLTTILGLPRANEETIFNKGISRRSVKKLLKKLRAHSLNYYDSATEHTVHSAFLDTIMDVVENGLGDIARINLQWEKIDGVTQGRFFVEQKKIRISLSRQGPVSAYRQSPQEAYAHEMVHVMTYFALKDNPILRDRLDKVYDLVKPTVTFNTFLPKGRKATGADVAVAKEEYDFVFENTDNEEHRLDEFLAYALTNQSLLNHLVDFPIAKRQGLLGKLRDLLDQIIAAFVNAMGGKSIQVTQSTAYAEMLAIAEKLVAIQNKHESNFIKKERQLFENLDKSDHILKRFIAKSGKFLLTAKSLQRSKLGRVFIKGAVPLYILISQNAMAIRAKQKATEVFGVTVRSLVHEVSEAGTLNKDYIDQMLNVRGLISKAQYQVIGYIQEWFNGNKETGYPSIWKSFDIKQSHAMKVEIREALTSMFFRTDLSSLLTIDLSHFEIGNLVNNKQAIEDQKTKILKQLDLSRADDVIKYTNDLGYWISTGLHKLRNSHTNVRSIAQVYKITDEKQIVLLNAYATLAALIHVQNTEKSGVSRYALDKVKDLINDEFKADSKENAVIDLLDTHLDYVDSVTKNLFKKNPNQMIKGYIIERVDDLTTLETGLLKDKRKWWWKGFRHREQLIAIPGIPNHHDTLYISYNDPDQKDKAGVLPSTNQKHMGTTLTEILSKNPKFQIDGRPDFGKINKILTKIKQREASAPIEESKQDVQLSPLRDDNGIIRDYRVMLGHIAIKRILNPELEIQNVFGHMKSAAIDRKYSLIEGKNTIDLVINEYIEQYQEDNKKMWVDILNPKLKYYDRYIRLPKSLREYIKEFSVGGKFLVKEDVINKVFSYRPMAAENVWFLQGQGIATQFAKHWVKAFHNIVKEFVGYGKDRIVIGMPEVVITNLMSNVMRLAMGKIPQSYIYHKINEGVREFFKYRELQRKRFHLQTKVNSRKLGENSPEAKELRITISKIKSNSIHPLSEAGVNSIIVEDLNEAQIDGYINKVRRLFKSDAAGRYITKIPARLLQVANWIYFTKGLKAYKYTRTLVQLTDFIARYVMVSYDTEVKNMPFKQAKHKAIDSFVLFDESLVPVLESIDVVGGTSFLSYTLRNNRSATQVVRSSPTSVGISAIIQDVTGIPTLGNLNAAWVTGDITPNLFQFVPLLDEATKATGFEIVGYFGDLIDEIID